MRNYMEELQNYVEGPAVADPNQRNANRHSAGIARILFTCTTQYTASNSTDAQHERPISH